MEFFFRIQIYSPILMRPLISNFNYYSQNHTSQKKIHYFSVLYIFIIVKATLSCFQNDNRRSHKRAHHFTYTNFLRGFNA